MADDRAWREDYAFHPLADILPMFGAAELQSLADDIRANGLREPIMLYEDMILDGRNRYVACVAAGVTPRFETYTGDDALAYVVDENLKRRQLTASQLAVCALDVEARYAEEARARQATSTGGAAPQLLEIVPKGEPVHAAAKAAALTGANPHYITDAKAIAKTDPALLGEVKAGKKTIPQARRELKERERDGGSADCDVGAVARTWRWW